MWELIHDESITASENMSIWFDEARATERSILFERNREGLVIGYYHAAFDALGDRFPAATICYGWDVIQVEKNEKDPFLTRVSASADIRNAITCDHDFTCEEIFHAAAVLLGNEDCEGCGPCSRYGKEEE
jgi:hypothetical protein